MRSRDATGRVVFKLTETNSEKRKKSCIMLKFETHLDNKWERFKEARGHKRKWKTHLCTPTLYLFPNIICPPRLLFLKINHAKTTVQQAEE